MSNITTVPAQNQETDLVIPRDGSVEFLIAKAIDKDTPIEVYEKLLAMRREVKAEYAKQMFDEAMAKFQGECPTIKKTKDGGKTDSGQVAYKYASLEIIVEQVKNLIKTNGFSYLIKTEVTHNGVTKVISTCIVKHKLGHFEESAIEMPLTTKTRVMSESQVVAATSTFAKRYAFCNAFGIMTGDEDNDGQTNHFEKQSPHQITQPPAKSMQTGATTKLYCSACPKKFNKQTQISQAVATYSYKEFGMRLCQPCQKLARAAKQKASATEQKPKITTQPEIEKNVIPEVVISGSPADLMKQGFDKVIKK